jgi:hypothetical protein
MENLVKSTEDIITPRYFSKDQSHQGRDLGTGVQGRRLDTLSGDTAFDGVGSSTYCIHDTGPWIGSFVSVVNNNESYDTQIHTVL